MISQKIQSKLGFIANVEKGKLLGPGNSLQTNIYWSERAEKEIDGEDET